MHPIETSEDAMLGRIWTLIIKELIQLRRNTLLWFMAIFGALLETALVAYSGSVPIEHLPLAVLDQDRTWASRALVVALENTETFDANYYLTDLDEVRRLIDRGKATAAVVIPRGFASSSMTLSPRRRRCRSSWTDPTPQPQGRP
jgi:ABC-2 type transport system permease protein